MPVQPRLGQRRDWRWLFFVPSGIAAVAATAMALTVKNTPGDAGFPNVVPEETATADHGASSESLRGVGGFADLGLRGWLLGRLLDRSWDSYFYFMAPFGIIGGVLMILSMRKTRAADPLPA